MKTKLSELTKKERKRLERKVLRKLGHSPYGKPVSPPISPIIEAYDKADIKRSINTKYWKEIEKFEAELFDGKDDDLEY